MALLDLFKFNKKAVENNSTETRSDTIAGATVSSWDSAYGYGRNVDRLSVVYGCVNLLSSTIASLPIQLNRKLEKGHEPAVDHPYYTLITKSPNGFQTNYGFYHWAVSQLLMFGNCYIQKIRNNSGVIVELYPLNPNSVDVYVRDDGMPYYKMNIVMPDGTAYYKEFSYDQVIHIKGYSRNGLYGLSIIDTFRRLFDGYNELEEAGTSIAKNAAKPSGVVYYPNNIKEEELEKMKSGWKTGFSQGNSGKTAFLPNNIKVEAANIGMTAQDAEYIAQKQFSAQRIAADIFRVPGHMLGLSTAPTYASVEMQAIEFVQYTLNPIITNIEQQIQKQLLDDSDEVYINFNVRGLLRGDVKTRIEYYRFALEHGVMTANQVNEEEDTGIYISPDKGGDDYVRPLNFAKVSNVSTPTPTPTIPSQAVESRADAPAPKKDQIEGSDINKPESASDKSGDIEMTDAIETALENKVKEHNAEMKKAKLANWTKVRIGSLKAVYRRGAGAYSTSHRPNVSRGAWAMARVNAFLYLAKNGNPQNEAYVGDNDLLNEDHPKYSKEDRSMAETGGYDISLT
jgi:HK97 family phage portal protein